MTPETAQELIEQERAAYPHVVDLARHLSLAIRIESELLRSMRLRAMSRVEAGVEADLYFSPLVQTRDVNAIFLIPEVRERLYRELAQHKDELEVAREVIESAHEAMDAAILLEERVVYHALRDDQAAYGDMQRQLGRMILELERGDVDHDLLGWAADAHARLPERARNSQAGRQLTGLLSDHLESLGVKLSQVTDTMRSSGSSISSVSLGFRFFGDGVELCYPYDPDWTEVEILAADPLSLELAWPVPEGWQSRSLELSEAEPVRQVPDVPPGLLRLRGINGDETRLRVEGPFQALKPKLLGLYRGVRSELPVFVEQELTDLSWELEWRSLRSQDRPQVFISMPGGWRQLDPQYGELKALLEQHGFSVWSADEQISPGDEWNKEISRVLGECQSAVVVLTSETSPQSDWLKHELSILAYRQEIDPDFSLHVLLSGGLPPERAASLLAGMELAASLKERVWHESAESVAEAIQREYPGSETDNDDFTAAIVHFPDRDALTEYADDLISRKATFVEPLENLILVGRPVMVYAAGRYQGRLHQGLVKYSTEAQASVLQDAFSMLTKFGIEQMLTEEGQEVSDRHQLLRSTLLDTEREAIMEWLRQQQEGQAQETAAEDDGNRLRWKIPGDDTQGHQGSVRSIAISADGAVALTAGNSHPDQSIKQWDLNGRRLIRSYEEFAEAGGWTPMAISPDGQRAATGYQGELRLIDLDSGEHSALLLSEVPLTALAFVDAERVLAGLADGMLLLVGSSGVEESFPLAREEVLRLDIRGQEAACLRPGSIELLDLRKGALLHRIEIEMESAEMEPHWQRPPLYYDKSDKRILFGTPLRALDLRSGQVSPLGDSSQPIVELVAERLVRYEGESAFVLLDDAEGSTQFDITIEPEQPTCLALAPNGRRMMIADYEHNLYVYDLELTDDDLDWASEEPPTSGSSEDEP